MKVPYYIIDRIKSFSSIADQSHSHQHLDVSLIVPSLKPRCPASYILFFIMKPPSQAVHIKIQYCLITLENAQLTPKDSMAGDSFTSLSTREDFVPQETCRRCPLVISEGTSARPGPSRTTADYKRTHSSFSTYQTTS